MKHSLACLQIYRDLLLNKADPKFKLIAKNALNDVCKQPQPSQNVIYFKTQHYIFAVEQANENTTSQESPSLHF